MKVVCFYSKSPHVGESIYTNNFSQQLPATLQTPDEQLIFHVHRVFVYDVRKAGLLLFHGHEPQ